MALAEKLLAEDFNRPGHVTLEHRTFVFLGDGCLMEGVSHEACSLAGTLGLGKLVAFYDDNGISIDGHVEGWFTDDTPKRFEAYGWRVVRAVDGHDAEAIDAAIRQALAPGNKPTLICCKTVIGWGAPKLAGTHDAHGAPLGADEAAATRAALGWRFAGFDIPADLRRQWDARAAGATAQQRWEHRFAAYAAAYPDRAAEFRRRVAGDLPAGFAEHCARWLADAAAATNPLATRKASQLAIEALAPLLPELLGGSADLTGSNLTNWKACVERREGPTSLLLTRKNLPAQGGGEARARRAARGGYVLADVPGGRPDVVLIATGSEVALAMRPRMCLRSAASPHAWSRCP